METPFGHDAVNHPRRSSIVALVTPVLEVLLIAALVTAAAAQEVKPFTIRVEDAVLADLQERLAKTRWPDQIPGSEWTYGVDLAYMRELTEYWRTQYNWRKHERALNESPQFTTEIDGLQIHFVHVRSPHPQALPLVLVHGWPGTFAEFTKILGPLTEPACSHATSCRVRPRRASRRNPASSSTAVRRGVGKGLPPCAAAA
jgi:hypothetical protein